MKLSGIVPLALLVYIYSFPVKAQIDKDKFGDVVTFDAVDPLKKVLREDFFFEKYEPPADVAKGEHATFQFVVRSDVDISAGNFRMVKKEMVGLSKQVLYAG
jgi:hypothetical protein